MWVDEACTIRPEVGQSYVALVVKLHRSFGLNDGKNYGSSDISGSHLQILTPDTEYPDDPFEISVYDDFRSEEFRSAFEANQVINVVSPVEVTIDSTFVFDFYDE